MLGNYYVILCSALLIIAISSYFYLKREECDVFDVYVIFVLFHFGVYPFIRGLYFGKGIIFDFTYGDPLSICLLFANVIFVLVILKIMVVLFQKYMPYLKIKFLIDSYSHINQYLIFFLCITLIFFQFYSYYKFGVKIRLTPEDFAKIGKDLPYWFTSFRTVYSCVAFCIWLVLLSYILKAKNFKHQLIWLILTIVFIPFVGLFGKKYLFAAFIIAFIFYIIEKQINIVKLRNIKYALLLIIVLLISSNLYQSYRDVLEHAGKITTKELRELKNPLAAATNYHATFWVLSSRPGTWEFSYLAFLKQVENGVPTTNGKILLEGFKSAIPRCLWPDKKFILIDDYLGEVYGVRPKEIDIGKNNFGIMQIEFGYLSLLIMPGFILILLVMMNYLNKITIEDPTFLWLFSSNILFYLINIEENGTDIFFMLRNILFLLIIFVIYLLAKRLRALCGKFAENFGW